MDPGQGHCTLSQWGKHLSMSVVHEPVLKAVMFANPITDSVNKVYGYAWHNYTFMVHRFISSEISQIYLDRYVIIVSSINIKLNQQD